MQELRKLFALLIGSKRKYVDPTKAVEVKNIEVFVDNTYSLLADKFNVALFQILKEALQYNGSESNPGNQQVWIGIKYY